MKTNTHPNWHNDCTVTCSCGNSFVTGSTKPSISVDICSACHPFFTGEMRFVDIQGRVERFQEKMKQAAVYKQTVKASKTQKTKEPAKSLKEMLQGLKSESPSAVKQ